MKDHYNRFLGLAAAGMLAVSANVAADDNHAEPSVLDDDWHMIAFAVAGDEEDREMVPIFSIRVDEDGAAEGIAACNRWSAQADFHADGKVRFKDFSETRSVCRFNDIVARTMDARYTDHLRNKDMEYAIDGDQLILTFDDGERWVFTTLDRDAAEPTGN